SMKSIPGMYVAGGRACEAGTSRSAHFLCRVSRAKKSGTPSTRCPITYQQLDLLILVDRAKLFALNDRARRFCGRHCRDRRCRSVALKQHGHHGAFGLFHKGELALPEEVDADEISQLHLSGCDQVGQWEHDVAFNGTLQVACSVFRVGSFAEQEFL